MINSDLVDDERDVHVGSDVVLDIERPQGTWHVIGIVSTESRGPAVYVSRDDFAYATRTRRRGHLRAGPGALQHDARRCSAVIAQPAPRPFGGARAEGQRHQDRRGHPAAERAAVHASWWPS